MPASKTAVETISCQLCADVIPLTESIIVDGEYLCAECAVNRTTICHRCLNRIYNDDDCGDDHISLCESCRDDYYTRCHHCDSLIPLDSAYYEDEDDDDDYPYCYHCYQNLEPSVIHNYSYKPEPIFYGKNDRFFGVELEVDGAGKSTSNAQAVLDILNAKDELGFIKSDGSLEDGFELVLHPMTLPFLQQQVPWQKLLDKLRGQGYYSHIASTCGLHVHVNRDSLGKSEEEQDRTIANVLYFYERFWEEILKFSRRTESQVRRWAARYGYKENGRDILEYAKKLPIGRYTAVNLCNYATVEHRIFRGTLKHSTIIATLQFVEKLCSVAFSISEEDIKSLSWPDFVQSIDAEKMPELVRYLKERMLYINEPVQSGTDTEEV